MNFKSISTIIVIVINFTIFTIIPHNINLVFSEVSESTLSDYEFHGYLEQMKGHLDASIINIQNNNSVLAVAHALHPIVEIVDIINNRLIQTNETLTKEFSSNLNQYVQTVRSDNLNKIITDKTELEKLLNDALDQSIDVEKRTNRDHILNVTAELISIASEEFNEAMFNGQIINLLEYQDGQQFINRAIMLLEETQAVLSDNDKKYLTKIIEMKKDSDLKNDPSEIDRNVKDMLCEIKKGFYC
jgi:hypothetical protein